MKLEQGLSANAGNQSIYISNSAIHGKGLFAARRFEAGEKIGRIVGRIIRTNSCSAADANANPNAVGIASGVWLEPLAPFLFLNHSCVPTSGLRSRATLFALADIDAGQEITLDYSTTEVDPFWRMDCRCGATACRGELRAIQFAFADASAEPIAPPGILRAWRRRQRT